jgi:hypothetical protein
MVGKPTRRCANNPHFQRYNIMVDELNGSVNRSCHQPSAPSETDVILVSDTSQRSEDNEAIVDASGCAPRRGIGADAGGMSPGDVELMLAYVLKRPEYFEQAYKLNLHGFFEQVPIDHEISCGTLTLHAMNVPVQPGRVPSRQRIEEALARHYDAHQLEQYSRDTVFEILRRVYALDVSDEGRGAELIQQFVHERYFVAEMKFHTWGEDLEADAIALTDLTERLAIVQSIDQEDRFQVYSAEEFLAANFQLEWLLEPFLVAGQPAVIGGPAKALKTSLALEMALCICRGTVRLFGHFPMEQSRRNVGFLSGESGGATIQDTLRRICSARGITIPTGLDICLRVPRLHDELGHLTRMIRQRQWKAVFIDPLYLAFLAGSTDPNAAMNLHKMGELLDRLCRACLELGCTPILIHHTTKHLTGRRGNENFEPLELTDVHGAGIAEYARQWILINRREPFEDGANVERVWLRVGGSAGHSGLWGVDVDQGVLQRQTMRRQHWRVSVLTATRARELAGQHRLEQRQEASTAEYLDLERRLLEALRRYPDGRYMTGLKESANIPRNKNIVHVLDHMINDGWVTRTNEVALVGATRRAIDVYRLVRDPAVAHPTPQPAMDIAPDGDGTPPADPSGTSGDDAS